MQGDFPEAAQPSGWQSSLQIPTRFHLTSTSISGKLPWGGARQAASDQQSPSAVCLRTAGLEHSPQASGPGVSAVSNGQKCQSSSRICLGHIVCWGYMPAPSHTFCHASAQRYSASQRWHPRPAKGQTQSQGRFQEWNTILYPIPRLPHRQRQSRVPRANLPREPHGDRIPVVRSLPARGRGARAPGLVHFFWLRGQD